MLLICCDAFSFMRENSLSLVMFMELHSRMHYMTRNSAKLFETDPNG